MLSSGVVMWFAIQLVGVAAAGAATTAKCNGQGRAASSMIQVPSGGAGSLTEAGANVSDNDTNTADASELQSAALTAKATAKLAKMRQDPFVEGWQIFVDCSMKCADDGGDSLDCAHQCVDAMEPGMQAGILEKAGLGSEGSPTPPPTPRPTTIVQLCAGDNGCLWEKCCKRYTAECLACTVDMSVPEFCEVHENLNTPGCAASLLQELKHMRHALKQAENR